jgi:hypothetical protein
MKIDRVEPAANLDSVHFGNFLDAIRGSARPNAPIFEGHRSTLLTQLGNIGHSGDRLLNSRTYGPCLFYEIRN